MFLAFTHGDGDTDDLLVLGLSRGNRERLEQGQPIRLTRATHGLSIPEHLTIVIFAGETEASMGKQMEAFIGPTTVLDQRRPQ